MKNIPVRSIWLNYHDVYEMGPRPRLPLSATMYHVSKDHFIKHLSAIKASGRRVITIREFLTGARDDSVVITFDDGWRGAFEIALPLLEREGWKATFFVTRDFVGRTGFCDQEIIQEAASAGMEIGVHGTTHRMLSACSRAEILWEFSACKSFLEFVLEQPVEYASLPGGDYSDVVASCARQAGLKMVCTSELGVNSTESNPFRLRRIAIRSTTRGSDVLRYCRYQFRKERWRSSLLQIPHYLLGMKNYTRLRRALLGERVGKCTELFKP